MTFTLSSLPFDFAALEPHIDAQTMEIHHGKHHAAYVNNLNAALEGHANLQNQTIEDILRNINDVPEGIRMAVRNNGGGHANHTLFWSIMGANGGGEPTGALAQAINSTFGDFNTFKQQMVDAGVKRFGSGWSWLIKDASGKLQVLSSANQDSPYMDGNTPIMGIDVWEHAYYLKYQNRRPDYLSAWWNTVNWHAVAANFEK